MTTYYTLSPDVKLSAFFWEDYYAGEHLYHTSVDVKEINPHINDGFTPKTTKSIKYPGDTVAVSHELKVHEDILNRKYFMYKNTPVYLENWDYHNITALVEEIEIGKKFNNKWFVPHDMILASLMKQSDKFGVLIQPRVAKVIIPGTSIGLCGDPEDESILFIPKLEPLREVKDWHYKIKFEPADESLRGCVGKEEYYFSDFVSLLYCNHLQLVVL